MKKITSDWHIHTEFSCDQACMTMEDLVNEQAQNGITDFGVSDHIHTIIQEDDIRRSRKAYDEILGKYPSLKGRFHFGAEVSVMSEWEVEKINKGEYDEVPIYGLRQICPIVDARPTLAIDDEFRQKYGIEYVVTGVHWPLYMRRDKKGAISEYFRQYLYGAAHPQTDILAHFLWWNACEKEVPSNPFSDFSDISEQMRGELECALKENDTAFELNLYGVVYAYPPAYIDEYLGWCKQMQDRGIALAVGSDCHRAHILGAYEKAEILFDKYGIDVDKFWKL